MGENDALKLQNIMEELRDLIDHKDCEIARWKEKEKEAFDMGFSEGHEFGMERAWGTAKDIVNLKWDGAYVKPKTVEEWFEMYTAVEAYDAMRACKMAKEKPEWIADYQTQTYHCSSCKGSSLIASTYCPWCGKQMRGAKA